MKEKIKKSTKKIAILKRLALVFTVLALTHLSYTFYEKYYQLKSEYRDSIFDELYFDEFHLNDYQVDDDLIYDLAYANHINDNIDESVEKIYEQQKKQELNAGEYWIGESVNRDDIRDEIIEKRAKYSAKIESEKEQHRLDLLRDIQLQKFELARGEKVARENIFSHFSVAYVLFVIIGESVIPLFFWLFWLINKMRLRNLLDLDKHRKIDLIKNHPKYAHDYNSKYESLSELEKSKILNQFQFTEKHNNLIQAYYLPILEEQRIDEKNELELKLKTALELGNITQDEFDSKIGFSRASKYKKNL